MKKLVMAAVFSYWRFSGAFIIYNYAIFDLPLGERIVVNDLKPEGLKTAIAWNVERNLGFT